MANDDKAVIHYPEHWDDLRELETAIYCHADWLKMMHRSMVCGLVPSAVDTRPDAHHHCRFGKWYYGNHHADLDRYENFRQLEATHREMHDCMRELLQVRQGGTLPSADLYDRFIDKSQQFSVEMRALQFQILGERYELDPLTGVPSRHSMMHRLEQEAARTSRTGKVCALCMVDFDRFKSINDQYGHQAGDAVLQTGVARIKSLLRSYDLIYRYGGEEFIVCLPDTPLEQAAGIAERMRRAIAESPITIPGSPPVFVTASFGLASFSDNMHIEDVIANADQALLSAKAAGRNQVIAWPEQDRRTGPQI